MFSIPRRLRISVPNLALFGMVLHSAAQGAEPLTWKFVKSEFNRYRTMQEIDASFALPGGGKDVRHILQVIDMSWTVDEVQPDGSAMLRQKIDRVQLTIESPNGEVVRYDSQSQDEPKNFSAMIAPLFRAMTSSEVVVSMTPRGQVADVEVPENLMEAMRAAPGADLLGELATADGFKKLVSRSTFELPESLELKDEWTTTMETENPMLGKQTIETTYRYVGPKDVDGQQFEAFEPKLEISFADAEVAEQESSGEILFSRAAGRLQSMTLDHRLQLVTAAGGKPLDVGIDQKMKMEWVPEEAK
jgi:hypothetical protein